MFVTVKFCQKRGGRLHSSIDRKSDARIYTYSRPRKTKRWAKQFEEFSAGLCFNGGNLCGDVKETTCKGSGELSSTALDKRVTSLNLYQKPRWDIFLWGMRINYSSLHFYMYLFLIEILLSHIKSKPMGKKYSFKKYTFVQLKKNK